TRRTPFGGFRAAVLAWRVLAQRRSSTIDEHASPEAGQRPRGEWRLLPAADIVAAMSDAPPTDRPALHRRLGLFLGPLLALLLWWLLPVTEDGQAGLTEAGRGVAAVGVWMATWWM